MLGSGSDTSDFLQQAELFNNGTGSVTSSVGLGRIDGDTDLASAGLRTAPTAGTFTVNGVSINYTAGETLNDVISSINSSSAGVTASYDSYEDQLVLSATARGPQSITVTDGTSNLATALRLTTSRQLDPNRPAHAFHGQRQPDRAPERLEHPHGFADGPDRRQFHRDGHGRQRRSPSRRT